MNELIKGAYDLHIHTAPDVVGRKYTDLETAEKLLKAGMSGFAIKSHQFNTGARAALVEEVYPGIRAVGGITLNRAVGGINPAAVEMAGRLGVKIVWFPTVDSKSEQDFLKRTGRAKSYGAGAAASIEILPITVFDEGKSLIPEVYTVLELIKRYDMVIATGHLSKQESLALLKAGHEIGLKKMVVTHPEFLACFATVEEQLEYIKYGAYIEHCYHTVWSGGCPKETLIDQILKIGPEHIFLTSDMGQVGSPDPQEGLLAFVEMLLEDGNCTTEDIRKMIVDNPKKLID